MKKWFAVLLALYMTMAAAGAMAETFTTSEGVNITAESIMPIESGYVGEKATFGAVAASQKMYDKIKGDTQDMLTDYSKKYFALTLPDGNANPNYKVRIPNSYFPGIEYYDVGSKVYVGYAQRGDGYTWTATVVNRSDDGQFEIYFDGNDEWGLQVTVPMTSGIPTVLAIVYKSAGGSTIIPGGPGVAMPMPGGAAATDMPQTGDPSMLGAWVCLLGASAMGLRIRRKK